MSVSIFTRLPTGSSSCHRLLTPIPRRTGSDGGGTTRTKEKLDRGRSLFSRFEGRSISQSQCRGRRGQTRSGVPANRFPASVVLPARRGGEADGAQRLSLEVSVLCRAATKMNTNRHEDKAKKKDIPHGSLPVNTPSNTKCGSAAVTSACDHRPKGCGRQKVPKAPPPPPPRQSSSRFGSAEVAPQVPFLVTADGRRLQLPSALPVGFEAAALPTSASGPPRRSRQAPFTLFFRHLGGNGAGP